MSRLKLELTGPAQAKMMKAIARKAGGQIRTIVTALHTEILSKTPMNTGRTLGSWHGSAGTPVIYDAAYHYGESYFTYDPARFEETNNMPVGAEPGRGEFEKHSLRSTQQINFEVNPYRIFYITNGATLDSIANSDFSQKSGSRAANLEYGNIAGYDLYGSTPESPSYKFTPRGTRALSISVENIRLKYGK